MTKRNFLRGLRNLEKNTMPKQVLSYIHEGEDVRPKQIREDLPHSRTAIQNVLRDLKGLDFVENNKDGRASFYNSTEKADRLFQKYDRISKLESEIVDIKSEINGMTKKN